jgi:RecA/RadA recombinase
LYHTRPLILFSQGFPPAKVIFTSVGILLLVCIFSYVRAAHRNATISQTAKNVRASEDALFEVFDRLEAFFRRLEIYTEVALDQRMVDSVAKIMAEVLNILGITTNKIRQGRMSKHFLCGRVVGDGTIFREISKEAVQKYG